MVDILEALILVKSSLGLSFSQDVSNIKITRIR